MGAEETFAEQAERSEAEAIASAEQHEAELTEAEQGADADAGRAEEAQEAEDNAKEEAQERQAGRQAQAQAVKVGDLFFAMWGYDQTNYDFMVVVGVSPSGKTATCQMARRKDEGHTQQADIQSPIAEGFGIKFRMKIYTYNNGEPQLRGSYPFVQDSRRLGTAYFHKDGEKYWATNPQFGH